MTIDKDNYPELHSFLSEIKRFISDFVRTRKKVFSGLALLFSTVIICGSILLVQSIPSAWRFLRSDIKYHVKTLVWVNIGAPVKITIPIKEVFLIPFKENLDVSVPVKGMIPIPIHHTFDFPVEKPIVINLDHSFPIKETLNVKTVVPINSTTNVNLFGINKNVDIKADIPVNFDFLLDHPFHFKEKMSLELTEPLSVYIDHTFNVPIDMTVDVNLPLDLDISVPLDFEYKTDITIKDKIPIIVEFDIVVNPLKGIRIDGIMLDGEKVKKGEDTSLPEGSKAIFDKKQK